MLAERALTDSLRLFGDTLMLVSYHVGQTYENPIALQRQAFYDTNLIVPYVIFDGTIIVWEESPSAYEERFSAAFNVARSATPLFNITIDNAVTSSTQGSFDLELVPTDTLPEDDIHAYIAICEDSLPGSYTTFMCLCRDMQDLTLDLVYPDSLFETIIFTHTIEANRLSAVVFIQDLDTKEVMQASMTRFQEE
jgi:hypothetical protein